MIKRNKLEHHLTKDGQQEKMPDHFMYDGLQVP